MDTGWGGKKLLDLIGQDVFSEKEERLRVRTDSSYPDIGTYPAHTMFIRKLYEQKWVNLRYNIMRINYFNSCIFWKFSIGRYRTKVNRLDNQLWPEKNKQQL